MLETQHLRFACTVLAGLDPTTVAAVLPTMARLASSDTPDADTAAWALFRITGDPEPFLARGALVNEENFRWSTARMLGDLGPMARCHLSDIEQRLTRRPQWWPTWEGVELGFAHYRITGDPALCLDVFNAALDPLRHGRQLPVSREALRHIATIGPAAARFTSLVRGVIEQDSRLLYSGGWRGIVEDDEAQVLAHQALVAIGS